MGENKPCLINIDLQPVASVANNIIDKFAQAVGWYAMPKGSKKDMETAVNIYISEIEKDTSIPPHIKVIKIATVRKETAEHINMQDILQHAQEFGQAYEDNEEDLDEDWAAFFYDKAKSVSRDDAKVLWGKILAEECNKAGSIPKLLIHVLSVMSANDARNFEKLCGFIVKRVIGYLKITDSVLLVFNQCPNKLFETNGVDFLRMKDLEALGLISAGIFDAKLKFDNEEENTLIGFLYGNHLIDIHCKGKDLSIGRVTLTEIGMVLSNMLSNNEINGFLEYVKDYYESIDCKVQILDVVSK